MIDELRQRIRLLESDRKKDPDQKQKRLLLNLDILTRSEQRSESLRKQLFDMIEKEGTIQAKLDTLEFDLRPEIIERTTSLSGSLRPEEVRESRRKSLAAEKTRLQSLLAEVQKNKANLELNIQKADELVERLRVKMEKEIDKALTDDDPESEN
jgi:septal ring factor EnvC (AmiA/AmiB activator)